MLCLLCWCRLERLAIIAGVSLHCTGCCCCLHVAVDLMASRGSLLGDTASGIEPLESQLFVEASPAAHLSGIMERLTDTGINESDPP